MPINREFSVYRMNFEKTFNHFHKLKNMNAPTYIFKRISLPSVKALPMNELLLGSLKDKLQEAIDYEKNNNTNIISTDYELNQLFLDLQHKKS